MDGAFLFRKCGGVFILWLGLSQTLWAFIQTWHITYDQRPFQVVAIYFPDPTVAVEKELAERVAAFVSYRYATRGTQVAKNYDFSGHRLLISIFEREESGPSRHSQVPSIPSSAPIGSIEVVYAHASHLATLPLLQRIQGWATPVDQRKALDAFKTPKKQATVAEIKKFATRKGTQYRFMGPLLAYWAAEYGMHGADVPAYIGLPPVEKVIAQTRPGAHVRLFRSLGFDEVLRLARDLDFADQRGLSLLRSTPEAMKTSALRKMADLRIAEQNACGAFFLKDWKLGGDPSPKFDGSAFLESIE